MELDMNYRKYLENGTKVSEIGFGSWQLGNGESWSMMTDSEAVSLVKAALEKGINFFDTSPNYANGNSEKLLGQAFKGVDRQSFVVNTKFGHTEKGQTDFRPQAIRKSVEGSLLRMNLDYIDSVLLHNPPRELMDQNLEHYEIFEKLKDEGKIKAYGASLDTYDDMIYFMEHTNGQVLELFFNILHQDTRQGFDYAKKKKMAIINKIPLDSGWLSGKYNQNSSFTGIRSRWSELDIENRAKAVAFIRTLPSSDQTMAQYALSYCLAYDAVSTVIPGCVNQEQLNNNIQSSQFKMSHTQRQHLEKLYDDIFKQMKLPW